MIRLPDQFFEKSKISDLSIFSFISVSYLLFRISFLLDSLYHLYYFRYLSFIGLLFKEAEPRIMHSRTESGNKKNLRKVLDSKYE